MYKHNIKFPRGYQHQDKFFRELITGSKQVFQRLSTGKIFLERPIFLTVASPLDILLKECLRFIGAVGLAQAKFSLIVIEGGVG